MREIKFRAWDKEENKWYRPVFEAYKGNLHELLMTFSGDLTAHTMTGLNHESLYPNKYEIMQYTGLKDKNGKEIYEGDVLSTPKGNQVVQWWQGGFSLRGKNIMDTRMYTNAFSEMPRCEVIGNIYSNKELLK